MKLRNRILEVFIACLILPASGFCQAPPYVRNDSAASINGPDLKASSAGTDVAGRVFVTEAPAGQTFQSCSGTNSGTSDVQIKAAVAGNRIYVTSVSCRNVATVASGFNFKDGSTEIWWAGISNTTLSGAGVYTQSFPVPLRLSVNTALNFDMETTATSTICCAAGYISTI